MLVWPNKVLKSAIGRYVVFTSVIATVTSEELDNLSASDNYIEPLSLYTLDPSALHPDVVFRYLVFA